MNDAPQADHMAGDLTGSASCTPPTNKKCPVPDCSRTGAYSMSKEAHLSHYLDPVRQAATGALCDNLRDYLGKEVAERYYLVDLAQEILDDPRIATTALQSHKYHTSIGQDDWESLLHRHHHNTPDPEESK